ncbi:hypothetical protein ACWGLF_20270 [Streptomyces puniciscabiei]
MRRTPDADGGSGPLTAMILIGAMPVAAGATVRTAKGDGDQPTMVGLVLTSTLLSPLTIPPVIQALPPLLSGACAGRVLGVVVPTALPGSLVLTYVDAGGALGSFLAGPRPLLLAAAPAVATLVCLLSFTLGRGAARLLGPDTSAASSLTLACGMNNSSAGAVLICAP